MVDVVSACVVEASDEEVTMGLIEEDVEEIGTELVV